MLEASSDLPDNVAALQAMIAVQNEKLSIFEASSQSSLVRLDMSFAFCSTVIPPGCFHALK